MTEWLHPGLVVIAAALPVLWMTGWIRNLWVTAVPLGVVYWIWQWPAGRHLQLQYLDYELSLVAVDHLSRVFALVFALFTAAALLFGCRQAGRRELAAALVCGGAVLGVVLAGDLITLFVFWELLAVGGALVIRANGTPAAYTAGRRYLYLHLCGCALLLAGIAGHIGAGGSAGFTAMAPDSLAHGLLLAGLLLGAAAIPLSFWLPDACSRASFNGAVVLSGLAVPVALYALLRGFPGTEILIALGLFMMVYGLIYAVLANALRLLLAYSLVNQAGFIMVAIGIGTEVALNAAVAMAVMLTLFMGLLFMTAGTVVYGTGRERLTELGGLYQSMPVTTACAIVGAISLLAAPLTGGHISRLMLDEAVRPVQFTALGWLLYAGAAAAVLHAGLRYPWFAFYHRDSGLRPGDPPWNMRLAMLLLAWLCILIGMAPCQLYALLPHTLTCEPYSAANVLTALQRIGFSALGFFLLLHWLLPRQRATPDVDWLGRRLLPVLRPLMAGIAIRISDWFARPAVREATLIVALPVVLLLLLYWL